MGYFKNRYVIPGFTPIGKFVCPECIENIHIQEFINNNLENKSCDYCGKKSDSKNIAADVEEVGRLIFGCLKLEYDEAANCLAYEGGYIWDTIYDTSELLRDDLYDDLIIENETLVKDISDFIGIDRDWCKRNPYRLNQHERLIYSWETFSEKIKYDTRFVFYKIKEKVDPDEVDIMPYEILDQIFDIAKEFALFKTLEREIPIYRCRLTKKSEKIENYQQIGPPLKESAVSQRMSPVGIVMFYGALDEETATVEVLKNKRDSDANVTIGTFNLLKKITVLDLVNLPDVPSLFDENNNIHRSPIIFLRRFREDCTKKVSEDDKEHIEYIPTQVVTEYFKHLCVLENGNRVEGIIYPSSYISGGRNVVLFINSTNCTQNGLLNGSGLEDKYLFLNTSSIKMRVINK